MTNSEFLELCEKWGTHYKPFICRFFDKKYICIGRSYYGQGDTPETAYKNWKEAVDASSS